MIPDLRQRLITAGILISGVLLVGIVGANVTGGKWLYVFVITLLIGTAAWEYGSMVCRSSNEYRIPGIMGVGEIGKRLAMAGLVGFPAFVAIFCFWFLRDRPLGFQSLVGIVSGIFFGALVVGYVLVVSGRESLVPMGVWIRDAVIGVYLIGVCGSALAGVALFEGAALSFLWLLFVVCLNDTAAYFSGKKFGGPKLAPLISPNKTVSGSIGGLVIGILVGVVCERLLFESWDPVLAALLSAIVVIAGQIGDLLKSYIKRSYGVKDTGSILPGHGGILDRVDGVLMAAPFLFLYSILTISYSL